jgi:hypothetical protein
MTDAIKKLREPAALAAAGYAALSVLASVIELLFTSGGDFSDHAAGQTGNLLNFSVALALAIAVFLANHVEPALAKARLVTLVSLITAGVAALLGLVSFFAGFGSNAYSGTDKFAYFLAGVGGALALGAAAWYVWLTWQTHAPAKAPESVSAAPQAGGPVGWGVPQGQPGVPGQPQGAAQPGQQPPGFGWTPGNPNEQTAYIPPQAAPGPQTLQAQQSHSGTFSVPQGQQQGAQPGQQAGQHAQPGQAPGQDAYGVPGAQPQGQDAYGVPGAQSQGQYGSPFGQQGQPQPGPAQGQGQPYGAQPGQQQPYGAQPGAQPGPQQQAPGAGAQQGGGERTQMMPPVPPTMQDYAPDPQPWQPAGPGGGQVPPQQPARPAHAAEQPTETDPNDGRQSGPFGVGNWQ